MQSHVASTLIRPLYPLSIPYPLSYPLPLLTVPSYPFGFTLLLPPDPLFFYWSYIYTLQDCSIMDFLPPAMYVPTYVCLGRVVLLRCFFILFPPQWHNIPLSEFVGSHLIPPYASFSGRCLLIQKTSRPRQP